MYLSKSYSQKLFCLQKPYIDFQTIKIWSFLKKNWRILWEGNAEGKCNSDLISKIMLRCIYGCQKWIPDKILHRNDNLIFFSTFIFSLKNIILKIKNCFFSKNLHGGQRRAFRRKKAFHFQNYIFDLDFSRSWENFGGTASM